MGLIRNYWTKFKNTKFYKWYKGLPVSAVGVTAFLAIIGFLTIIFNWYWSGLGQDPSRQFILSLTNDKTEFIEYTTLYIYLISFGATLFAGLAVFLVFNDWKEQHNTNIEKEYLKEIFDELRKYNKSVFLHVEKAKRFIVLENNFNTGKLFEIPKEDIKEFQNSYNHLITILGEYTILAKDKNVSDFSNDYDNLAKNTLAIFEGINDLKIEVKRNVYGEIDEYEEEIEKKKIKALKDYLMKEQSLTIKSKKTNFTYWLILDRFKTIHNEFYIYLLENKLKK